MIEYGEFINQALHDAAHIAVTQFGHVSSTVKPEDNNQVLTKTDIEIGELLVKRVQASFPDHNIIDEEAGVIDNDSQFTWVIDPIDGTSNFAKGSPNYGTMIGLLDGDVPVAGGVVLPQFNAFYLATKNAGATLNGQRIHVVAEPDLINALVAYGIDGHQEAPVITHDETALLAAIILGIRNLRSTNSVVDQMYTAAGVYGATLNRTSKIWDNVAQQIIIEEAGGVYTDFFGNPVDYSYPLSKVTQNFTWCAGAPELHSQLQSIINGNK